MESIREQQIGQKAPTESTRTQAIEPKVDEGAIGKHGGATISEGKTGGAKSPATELVDIIQMEHDMAKSAYGEYKSATDLDTKLKHCKRIMEIIVQHSGKEEIALYPAMRDIPSLGDVEVEQAKKEHLQVTNDLCQVDQLLPKAKDANVIPQLDQLVEKVMSDLSVHISDEESRLLPIFAREVDPSKAQGILDAYKNAIVTTRPHPGAPHEGLSAHAAHVVSKPIDAAINAVRGV